MLRDAQSMQQVHSADVTKSLTCMALQSCTLTQFVNGTPAMYETGAPCGYRSLRGQLPLRKQDMRVRKRACLQSVLAWAHWTVSALRVRTVCGCESGLLCAPLRMCEIPEHTQMRLPSVPDDAPADECTCGAPTATLDSEHAFGCTQNSALTVRRHDETAATLREVLTESGVSSTLEPLVRSLFSGAGAAGRNMQAAAAEALRARRAARAARAGQARGDVLCVMDRALHVIDVVWVHPAGQAQRRAASRSAGAAASGRRWPQAHAIPPARRT